MSSYWGVGCWSLGAGETTAWQYTSLALSSAYGFPMLGDRWCCLSGSYSLGSSADMIVRAASPFQDCVLLLPGLIQDGARRTSGRLGVAKWWRGGFRFTTGGLKARWQLCHHVGEPGGGGAGLSLPSPYNWEEAAPGCT